VALSDHLGATDSASRSAERGASDVGSSSPGPYRSLGRWRLPGLADQAV